MTFWCSHWLRRKVEGVLVRSCRYSYQYGIGRVPVPTGMSFCENELIPVTGLQNFYAGTGTKTAGDDFDENISNLVNSKNKNHEQFLVDTNVDNGRIGSAFSNNSPIPGSSSEVLRPIANIAVPVGHADRLSSTAASKPTGYWYR